MRILYIGPLWEGNTCKQRMIALQDLGHAVTSLDVTPPKGKDAKCSLFVRLRSKLGFPSDLTNINIRLQDYVNRDMFDLVWIDKVLEIRPVTLKTIRFRQPTCHLIFYSPDDMCNPGNQSYYYHKGIPLYDLHVTTKSYNVPELQGRGASDVFFVGNGFDPHTHRPLELTADEKKKWGADVGFIGGFELQRYQTMMSLAKTGINVLVRGPTWELCERSHPSLVIKSGYVFGDDYARVISGTKINLCFLRKDNRDLQTTRSVEIPACGGFMLAERTSEHLDLFEEGKEAEFFSDGKELIFKIRYYLDHEQERVQIAARGRERCLHSGYSNYDRLRAVLHYLYRDFPDVVSLI